jgi:hypothetical protein
MIKTYEVPPAENFENHTNGWTMPAPAAQNRRRWSNAKRKTIILTAAASAAIVGLGATNVITALNASAADAAHHRQMVAMKNTYNREIQQIKAQDAATLLATTQRLRTDAHNALAAQKTTDAKIATAQANSAYANGTTNGYTTGYSSGNNAGYSTGYGAGNSAGYAAGNTAGYSSGYTNGSINGYSAGYTNGAATATPPYTGY